MIFFLLRFVIFFIKVELNLLNQINYIINHDKILLHFGENTGPVGNILQTLSLTDFAKNRSRNGRTPIRQYDKKITRHQTKTIRERC